VSVTDPLRLLALVGVVAVVVAYLVTQARRRTYTLRFTNLDLVDTVAPKRPGWRRHLPAGLFSVALALLVVAWAGPTAPVRVPVERATVILAIDVSLSMQATDVAPDRLEAAKVAALDFLEVVPPELNVGLVTFSGIATITVPPTTDRDLLAEAVTRLQLAERTAIGEAIFASLDAGRLEALCRASMLASWDYDHRYCGRCGTPTRRDPKEAARVCPSCAFRSYPRVSPAMIVRITDGRRILLAHNRRFPGGVFSCVAGYVDPGESLEATVLREIKEEVGLDAAPPRYLSSQAWPFPHSLMLGFATTASGEPVPDGVEITDARWFDPEDLPHIPRRGTISRRIIDLWLDEIGVPSPPDRYW